MTNPAFNQHTKFYAYQIPKGGSKNDPVDGAFYALYANKTSKHYRVALTLEQPDSPYGNQGGFSVGNLRAPDADSGSSPNGNPGFSQALVKDYQGVIKEDVEIILLHILKERMVFYDVDFYIEVSQTFNVFDEQFTRYRTGYLRETGPLKDFNHLDAKELANEYDRGYSSPELIVNFVARTLKHESRELKFSEVEKYATNYALITDQQVIKEATERGILLAARAELGGLHYDIYRAFQRLVEIYQRQPFLNKRTSRTYISQQYSTPIPLAFLANLYAGTPFLNARRHWALEPYAGNGLLTLGAERGLFVVNEIDSTRFGSLSFDSGQYKAVTSYNIVNHIDTDWFRLFATETDLQTPMPFAVVTNPPFGKVSSNETYEVQATIPDERTGEPTIRTFEFNKLDHILTAKALQAEPERAAIIMGGHTKQDSKGRVIGKDKDFFVWLYNSFYVDDVINISGDLYKKQGTRFPIRLILVSGVRPQEETVNVPPGTGPEVTTWNEVFNNITLSSVLKRNPTLFSQLLSTFKDDLTEIEPSVLEQASTTYSRELNVLKETASHLRDDLTTSRDIDRLVSIKVLESAGTLVDEAQKNNVNTSNHTKDWGHAFIELIQNVEFSMYQELKHYPVLGLFSETTLQELLNSGAKVQYQEHKKEYRISKIEGAYFSLDSPYDNRGELVAAKEDIYKELFIPGTLKVSKKPDAEFSLYHEGAKPQRLTALSRLTKLRRSFKPVAGPSFFIKTLCGKLYALSDPMAIKEDGGYIMSLVNPYVLMYLMILGLKRDGRYDDLPEEDELTYIKMQVGTFLSAVTHKLNLSSVKEVEDEILNIDPSMVSPRYNPEDIVPDRSNPPEIVPESQSENNTFKELFIRLAEYVKAK